MPDPTPSEPEPLDPTPAAATWRFANLEYDTAHGELRVDGAAVPVERRPRRLLEVLLAHVNEVVTKEELFETVWAGRSTVEHVLTNAVSKLRTALGPEAAARIVTVPRAGYRLLGPVQRITAPVSDFSGTVGQPVPGADGYVFERALGSADPPTVWLARHPKLGLTHVFKFATEGRRLAALRREHTLYRVLLETLGPREDVARLVGTNFSTAPFFLKCDFGGESLLDWAERGGLAALSVEARLGVFVRIARAVAAAHSVGVLHKDVKPGNVLIDVGEAGAEPAAWKIRLTDFGSGRLLDPSQLDALRVTALGLTQTQNASGDSRSGTPMYLAPELIAGHAPTVRSDVYALGVLLFQVLAGDLHRPLVTGWQRDVSDPLLVEDITAATEGDPEKRLGSAGELADRVHALAERRRAREEAEAAAARSAADQAEVLRRRARRPWVVSAMLALTVGLAFSIAFYLRAETAAREAGAEARRAGAINEFLTRDVLQAADVTAVGSNKVLVLGDVLDRSSKMAAQRFEGLPQTEGEIRVQLGELYSRISAFAAAEREFERAVTLFEGSSPGAVRDQLEARYAVVRALAAQSKLEAAGFAIDAADAKRAARPAPNQPSLELAAVRARSTYEAFRQKYPEALKAAARAVELSDQLYPRDPGVRFAARRQWATMLMRNGQFADEKRVLDEMLAPPYSPESVGEVVYARGQALLGQYFRLVGEIGHAEAPLVAARDTLIRRLGPDEPSVGNLQEALGALYLDDERFDQARQGFAEALRVNVLNFGMEHQASRVNSLNLALVGLNDGHAREALAQLESDRPWFVSHMGGENSPVVNMIDFFRVRAMLDIGDDRGAARLLPMLNAEKINEAGPSTTWSAAVDAEQGRWLLQTGRKAEAAALLRPSLVAMKAGGSKPAETDRYSRALERAEK